MNENTIILILTPIVTALMVIPAAYHSGYKRGYKQGAFDNYLLKILQKAGIEK